MLRIASPHNAKYKSAVRLHSSRGRKVQGRFLIHGEREIQLAAQSKLQIVELFVCSEMTPSEELLRAAEIANSSSATLLDLTAPLFRELTFGDRPENAIAVGVRPRLDLAKLTLPDNPLVLVLEALEKPGNVGAVFRSADGSGVDAIILANPQTDLFHPNAIRASLGTVFHVPAAIDGTHAVIEWLARLRFAVFIATPSATQRYSDADFRGRCAVVFGSEAFGMSSHWGATAQAICLPMLGVSDSLNISNAAAIISYEANRQRSNSR